MPYNSVKICQMEAKTDPIGRVLELILHRAHQPLILPPAQSRCEVTHTPNAQLNPRNRQAPTDYRFPGRCALSIAFRTRGGFKKNNQPDLEKAADFKVIRFLPSIFHCCTRVHRARERRQLKSTIDKQTKPNPCAPKADPETNNDSILLCRAFKISNHKAKKQ